MQPNGAIPVLQVHPTRRCNLRCRHCYSLSGPEQREELDVTLARRAVADAHAEGYRGVSLSGGEPLLYSGLRELLAEAKGLGMRTAIASNGMLLDARRLAVLQGVTDLLAISLDGVPDSHNLMRGSSRAFETMVSRLEGVRGAGIPFGFIFTLTQHNLHELEWVVDFALAQGAGLVQAHPLEETGRARAELRGARPDGMESAFAYLEVQRLREVAGERLVLQLDLAGRAGLRRRPERVYADDAAEPASGALAELVAPLVIEPDGTVSPLEYGFGRAFAVGNLHDAPLHDLAQRWRIERYPAFRALCRRVFEDATGEDALPLVNWYELVGAASEAAG